MEPYLALFEADRKAGGYVVTFPDFGYGATQGESEQEAMEMARDLLMLTIEDCIREGRPLPPATRRRGCRMGILTAHLDQLFSLRHRSRLDQIEAALEALGKRLHVEVRDAA
jgi:antitoxin HicB